MSLTASCRILTRFSKYPPPRSLLLTSKEEPPFPTSRSDLFEGSVPELYDFTVSTSDIDDVSESLSTNDAESSISNFFDRFSSSISDWKYDPEPRKSADSSKYFSLSNPFSLIRIAGVVVISLTRSLSCTVLIIFLDGSKKVFTLLILCVTLILTGSGLDSSTSI